MANKSYWDQDLEEFNPYYAQFYNKDGTAKTSQNNDNAKSTLRDSENSALSGEKSFFTGSGKNDKKQKGKKPVSLKTKRKRFSVILTIITLLGGGVSFAFLGSSHSLLAPALEALTTEATDTQYASYQKRSAKILNYMLKKNDPTKSTWLGGKKYKRIPSRFQKRLKAQGIEFDKSKGVLKFNGKNIDASDFAQYFKEDIDFRESFMKAKLGRVANFFDKIAGKIHDHFGLTLNLWKDYKQGADSEENTKKFRETMSSKFEGDSTTTKVVEPETETDEDGNTKVKTDENGNPIKNTTDLDADTNNTKADATTKAKSYVGDMASKAASLASGICGLMRVGATISVAVAANEIYQSINYYMALMENPSKMMAGDGDASAINETLNMLTTPVTTSITEVGDVQIKDDGNGGYTSEGKEKEVDITGPPIAANGLQMMLAGAPAQSTTTQRYSFESTINSFAKALNLSNDAAMACTVAQAGGAIISIIVQVATLGTASVAGLVYDVAKSAATSIAASAILSFIVPHVAEYLFSNIFETVTGIPAGELMARGGSAANTRMGRSGSSQSPSSENVALAYAEVNQEVIAMDAEIDRKNRSPFDISSKNTFLGSIAYKILPLTLTANQTTSSLSTISSFTRLTSNSLASLTNSAFAKGKDSTYMTTFGDCPQLETIDAVGDIYCNPVTTTDPDLIDLDPDDTKYVETLQDELECDEDGDCQIKDDSELVKYIVYCANRDSPFGVVDANILNALRIGEDSESGNKIKTILGWVPIVGDVIDVIDAGTDAANLPWATGEKCVNSSKNPDWDKFKYFQRYYEDQRILEQMGAYEDSQSPIIGLLEKYESEHPLDNSPAGYLSRISGITKDDAEMVIALAEYTEFLEKYDPDTRIAMTGYTTNYKTGEEVASEIQNKHLHFKSKTDPVEPNTQTTIARQHIIYADVRNRNHTTA